MGWYYTRGASRRDIVNELILKIEYDGYRRGIPAHCLRGNTLWTVEERIYSEHELYDSTDRFIGCYLLQNDKGYGWGYKPMDESLHPCYYTCPVKYLAMVPEVQCQPWRDEVMKRHARMNRAFRIGQKVGLLGAPSVPWAVISSLRPLIGVYGGQRYRLPRRLIGDVLEG